MGVWDCFSDDLLGVFGVCFSVFVCFGLGCRSLVVAICVALFATYLDLMLWCACLYLFV